MAAFVPGLTFRSYHSASNPQNDFAIDYEAGATLDAAALPDELRAQVMQGAHVGASTGPRTADPSERLRELAAMRDQGLITAEDFEAKKAEILRDL